MKSKIREVRHQNNEFIRKVKDFSFKPDDCSFVEEIDNLEQFVACRSVFQNMNSAALESSFFQRVLQ
jgi:hypothetical protein